MKIVHRLALLQKKAVSLPMVIAITLVVAGTGFVVGTRWTTIQAAVLTGRSSVLDLSSLQSLYDTLRTKYDGNLDTEKLIDGARHGLVEAAGDPYTVYFNAKEASEFQNDLDGTFSGVGAELGKRDEKLIIVSTLDGSPAQRSGLQSGDVILKVNDQDSSQWSVDKAVSQIRGEKGTTVKISVTKTDGLLKDYTITRDVITDPSVTHEVVDGVGIMRISRFGDKETVDLATKAAEDFKSQNVRGVVVDVRGNGGGYLDTAPGVAGLWLRDKVVVTERRAGKITETLRTGKDAVLEGVPTIVLVDGGSASASEILAGALRDNKAARLVGQKTFGKGSVQTLQDLSDGGQLKVTIAKWYTPAGKNISAEGINPDVEIAITAENLTSGQDPQRDKALELLK